MKNKIVYIFLGLNLIVLGFVAWNSMNKPRYAYVDLGVLYENFTLKKELESKYENIVSARKMMLDSMEIRLRNLSDRLSNHIAIASKQMEGTLALEFEGLKQQYFSKKQNFEQDNERTKSDYSSQVWKQLNQYVKEYGKEKGYDYIFGADGSGALMYASEAENITEYMKGYLNQRYAGHTN